MLTKSFIKFLLPASRLPPPADPDFRRDVALLRCRLATGLRTVTENFFKIRVFFHVNDLV